jgi:hypothetical protein
MSLFLSRRSFTKASISSFFLAPFLLKDQKEAEAAAPIYSRLAYCCDGNYHDRDDWGSSSMALALLGDAGYQRRLTHFEYNNHIEATRWEWEQQMATSVHGAHSRWNHTTPYYDCQSNVDWAVDNLAFEINRSVEINRLLICAAGPMKTIYHALDQSDSFFHRYVTILSHSSKYNEQDGTFNLNRIRRDFPTVKIQRIANQNERLNTKDNWRPWFWLRDGNSNLKFLWSRMRASGRADVSDAGMVYYAIYNNQYATPNDLRRALTS